MAAPNLRIPTTVTGKTKPYAVTTTLAEVLANAAASGKLLKINTIRVANVDNTSSASVDITFYRSTTHYYLLKAGNIDIQTALVISNKDEYIYLEEGDALYAKASAAGDLELTVNYEEIS